MRELSSNSSTDTDAAPDHWATDILTQYRQKGIGARVGFGRRPAVLVIDFIRGFTEIDSPLGSDLDSELGATEQLLTTARQAGAPIMFTTTAYDENLADAGLFISKVPSLSVLKRGSRWTELDIRLGRRPEELLIEKQYASAFFGTGLSSILAVQKVDTLVLAGCTTSGCVRATAVDALQHGYHAIVPRECVGDRAPEPHLANLLDIDAKYGDVMPLDAVLLYLKELPVEPERTGK